MSTTQASAREKVVRLKASGENVAEWTNSVTNRFQSKYSLPPFDVIEGHHLVNLGVINPANASQRASGGMEVGFVPTCNKCGG